MSFWGIDMKRLSPPDMRSMSISVDLPSRLFTRVSWDCRKDCLARFNASSSHTNPDRIWCSTYTKKGKIERESVWYKGKNKNKKWKETLKIKILIKNLKNCLVFWLCQSKATTKGQELRPPTWKAASIPLRPPPDVPPSSPPSSPRPRPCNFVVGKARSR